MTKFVKKDQLSSTWYEIDATNAVVGRLASVIASDLSLEAFEKSLNRPYSYHLGINTSEIINTITHIRF